MTGALWAQATAHDQLPHCTLTLPCDTAMLPSTWERFASHLYSLRLNSNSFGIASRIRLVSTATATITFNNGSHIASMGPRLRTTNQYPWHTTGPQASQPPTPSPLTSSSFTDTSTSSTISWQRSCQGQSAQALAIQSPLTGTDCR